MSMRTVSAAELDRNWKNFILSRIEDTDGEQELNTTAEKLAFCKTRFEGEQGWDVPRTTRNLALEAWLSGLCSTCSLPYNNHEILELCVQLGSLPADYSDRQADKILAGYWGFMANKLGQMFDGYRVPKEG